MNDDALIFLHGWGMPTSLFDPLIAFKGSTNCLTPALPGYAESPWEGGLCFEQQVEQMGEYLPQGRLVGWSLGGLYATGIAARFPQKFSALTLIACNPCFVKKKGWDCALEAELFDQFYEDLMLDWKRTLQRFLALQMQGEKSAREMTRSLGRQLAAMGAPDLEVLKSGLEILKNQDSREELKKLAQPVNLILGDLDRLVPRDLQQQIPDLVPGIRVESVAGASHAPFLSHPERIAALI